MDKTQAGHITTATDNRICTITFFHPMHNSLPGKLLGDFKDAIYEAGASEDNDLIVIQSEGERTYCAGASFNELVAIEDFPTGKTFFMGFANIILYNKISLNIDYKHFPFHQEERMYNFTARDGSTVKIRQVVQISDGTQNIDVIDIDMLKDTFVIKAYTLK